MTPAGPVGAPLRPHVRTKPWTQLRQKWVKGGPPLQLLPPQIRVRTTPDSEHDGDGPAHLRFVPEPAINAWVRALKCG